MIRPLQALRNYVSEVYLPSLPLPPFLFPLSRPHRLFPLPLSVSPPLSKFSSPPPKAPRVGTQPFCARAPSMCMRVPPSSQSVSPRGLLPTTYGHVIACISFSMCKVANLCERKRTRLPFGLTSHRSCPTLSFPPQPLSPPPHHLHLHYPTHPGPAPCPALA